MSSVLNPPRSPSARAPRRTVLIAVAVAASALGLLLVAQRLLPSAASVRRITVANPTPYHLEIDTTGVGRAHAIALGPIGREQEKTFDDVIDQGREWIFRFASGGVDAGEIRVAREELNRNGWKITVGDDVARRLQAAGVPPSPHE
jgi:hypothetical protein